MRIREGLEIDEERLAEICRRFHIRELSLFGSVLRDDFGPDSDVDVLYEGDIHLSPVPWAIVAFARELEEMFGRRVDVVGKNSIHWFIRDRVLDEARPMYAA